MSDRPADFATRVTELIARFSERRGIASPVVEVELRDETRWRIESISAEPGHGFVTFAVYPGEEMPKEIVVPVNVIVRIELFERDEPDEGFGFAGR